MQVSPDGRVRWHNAAARLVLDVWGVEVGGELPVRLREELASLFASGNSHAVLLGNEGDPAFEASLARDGRIWLHARADTDPLSEEVRAARRTKSAFLANMSHELRTPLNAILGYTELLQEEASELGVPALVPDLLRVNRAATHLLKLINDILDVSKIEAGRMGLFLETFSILDLVDDVVETIRPLVEANHNRLVVQLDVDDPSMRSDRTKIRQILFNLLDNACKFTESGTLTIGVRSDGTVLELSVTDTGIGMTEEEVECLFEPFTQADTSTTRRFGGTGLGLAICRLLCQLLGGTIGASSREGSGSSFEVRLPLRADAALGVTEAPPGVEVHGHGEGTILVIDDDPSVRDLLGRFLAKEGYRVIVAPDGETGLQVARDQRPDAITLDVMMPRTDGWEVLRRLKADEQVRDIPVVMLSIIDNTGLGFALGASEYLTKPIDRRALLEALAPFRGGGRVLVVDDNADLRDLMVRTLGRAGWKVEQAEDGSAALAWLEHNVPDVVVLDLLMPGIDGFAVVEAMRGRPAWRDIPVVVLTAKDLTPADQVRLRGAVRTVVEKGGASLDRIVEELRAIL